jgi:redox-sensitive bicupin YhaK (pirin superfamily)
MENTVLHKADTRGHADHGWLHKLNFSFSFSSWYNPENTVGTLRVLNDDVIEKEWVWDPSPRQHGNHHDSVRRRSSSKDSMGNAATIKNGDVQVMSAGIQHTGI